MDQSKHILDDPRCRVAYLAGSAARTKAKYQAAKQEKMADQQQAGSAENTTAAFTTAFTTAFNTAFRAFNVSCNGEEDTERAQNEMGRADGQEELVIFSTNPQSVDRESVTLVCFDSCKQSSYRTPTTNLLPMRTKIIMNSDFTLKMLRMHLVCEHPSTLII